MLTVGWGQHSSTIGRRRGTGSQGGYEYLDETRLAPDSLRTRPISSSSSAILRVQKPMLEHRWYRPVSTLSYGMANLHLSVSVAMCEYVHLLLFILLNSGHHPEKWKEFCTKSTTHSKHTNETLTCNTSKHNRAQEISKEFQRFQCLLWWQVETTELKASLGSQFWKVLICDYSHDDKAIKCQCTYISMSVRLLA